MSLDPKASKKLPSGWSQKLQANSKSLKGGREAMKQKQRPLGKTSKKYQKP
jgi:hypothetical protein